MNQFAMKLAASTAVVTMTLAGFRADVAFVQTATAATGDRAFQQAERFAEQARAALQGGSAERGVELAERAVELSPRDLGYRMLLADLYMRSGRFVSAETSYSDVLQIDPTNERAALSIALMQIAQGRTDEALGQLEALVQNGSPSDVGLAFALAGQTQRAIQILEPAARAPEANGRTRQNLALTYALAGDWQRARTIAAQDVSPAELSGRLQQWAQLARPSSPATQVAGLLGVSPREDAGQPVRLALAPTTPEPVALAAAEAAPQPEPEAEAPVQFAEAVPAQPAPVEAAAPSPIQYAEAIPATAVPQQAEPAGGWWPTEAPSREVPAPIEPQPAPSAPVRFAAAEVPVPKPTAAVPEARYVAAARSLSAPQPALLRASTQIARAPRPVFEAARPRLASAIVPLPRPGTAGRFVVQLGAFSNPQNAERAWAQAERRFGLASGEPRTTTIAIGGRTLHRVSIGGFGDRAGAARVCASIQSRGGACFVRATAGDAPVRWASYRNRARPA
jgi:Flp pilus assembly protein TadD